MHVISFRGNKGCWQDTHLLPRGVETRLRTMGRELGRELGCSGAHRGGLSEIAGLGADPDASALVGKASKDQPGRQERSRERAKDGGVGDSEEGLRDPVRPGLKCPPGPKETRVT